MIRHWLLAMAVVTTAFGCLPEGRTEADMDLSSPDCNEKEVEQFIPLNTCVMNCLDETNGAKAYSLCESKCVTKLTVSDVCLDCTKEWLKTQCSTLFDECKEKCEGKSSISCIACTAGNCGLDKACR